MRDCIGKPDECQGEVEIRPSFDGHRHSDPRCDHWDLRLRQDEEHRRIYPDKPDRPVVVRPDARRRAVG